LKTFAELAVDGQGMCKSKKFLDIVAEQPPERPPFDPVAMIADPEPLPGRGDQFGLVPISDEEPAEQPHERPRPKFDVVDVEALIG